MSTILDPRYKDLKFLSYTLKLQIESQLRVMYEDLHFELNPNDNLLETSTTKNLNANEDSIFNALFGSESNKKKANEVDVYLNENLTVKPGPKYNPYICSKIFQELLFVKRNSKYMDIFTLLANKK
ncbi:unnamed protein product [Rhizophagus irregularis]|nr:unnamed protein product [Rhizophagus irregularis]